MDYIFTVMGLREVDVTESDQHSGDDDSDLHSIKPFYRAVHLSDAELTNFEQFYVKEFEDLMKEVDIDGNGKIDYEEFVTMMVKQKKDNIMEKFRMFDKDGSGTINAEEVRLALNKFGEKLTKEELDELMKDADIDRNGEINYPEFVMLNWCKY